MKIEGEGESILVVDVVVSYEVIDGRGVGAMRLLELRAGGVRSIHTRVVQLTSPHRNRGQSCSPLNRWNRPYIPIGGEGWRCWSQSDLGRRRLSAGHTLL